MTWRLHSDRKMKQQQEIFDMVASVCVCVLLTILFRFSNRQIFLHSPPSTVLFLSVNCHPFETGNEFVGSLNPKNKPQQSFSLQNRTVRHRGERDAEEYKRHSSSVWRRKREDL